MKIMNEVPLEVHARICNLVEKMDMETVHMGYGSPLEDDIRSFVAIIRERRDDKDITNGYAVYLYDSENDVFDCYRSGLTYAHALIEMGTYIDDLPF